LPGGGTCDPSGNNQQASVSLNDGQDVSSGYQVIVSIDKADLDSIQAGSPDEFNAVHNEIIYVADPSLQTDLCTSTSPCLNGGACTDLPGSYSCACVAGYSGDNCETDIDDCDPNPCQNGGACADGVDTYTCTCTAEYTGDTCGEIKDCPSGTDGGCGEHGTCDREPGGRRLSECPLGDQDSEVDAFFGDCATYATHQYGGCGADPSIDAVCCVTCPPCEEPNDDGWAAYNSWSDPCSYGVLDCSLLGEAGDGTADTPACDACPQTCCFSDACPEPAGDDDGLDDVCLCDAGYETDPAGLCNSDIDECTSSPCNSDDNGATCANNVDGYVCTCSQYYEGTTCTTPVDQCPAASCDLAGDGGDVPATCSETAGADGTCNCPAGTTGNGEVWDGCSGNADDVYSRVYNEVTGTNHMVCDGEGLCIPCIDCIGDATCDTSKCQADLSGWRILVSSMQYRSHGCNRKRRWKWSAHDHD